MIEVEPRICPEIGEAVRAECALRVREDPSPKEGKASRGTNFERLLDPESLGDYSMYCPRVPFAFVFS